MTEHRRYLHTEYRENSLRCTCGEWMGRNCVDVEGFEEHVRAARPVIAEAPAARPTETCPDYQNEPEGA